jgi:hypothetical protein
MCRAKKINTKHSNENILVEKVPILLNINNSNESNYHNVSDEEFRLLQINCSRLIEEYSHLVFSKLDACNTFNLSSVVTIATGGTKKNDIIIYYLNYRDSIVSHTPGYIFKKYLSAIIKEHKANNVALKYLSEISSTSIISKNQAKTYPPNLFFIPSSSESLKKTSVDFTYETSFYETAGNLV